jgi:ABC-type multidrug transport system ATPase subunit
MAERCDAIRVRGLSKRFEGRVVWSDVGFDVADGETVAVTGENGAGKTTLLRCLASACRPDAGDVQWFGQPASGPPARRLIGLVAHESCLYPHLTVRENLIFAGRMTGVCDPSQRADRLLEDAAMSRHAHRRPPRLSQGMRRRIAVVRALVHDPRILFLDEPFSSLDAEGARWLYATLAELRRRRRTICFVTHDPAEVRQLADRVFHLRSGRLYEIETKGCRPPATSAAAARAA